VTSSVYKDDDGHTWLRLLSDGGPYPLDNCMGCGQTGSQATGKCEHTIAPTAFEQAWEAFDKWARETFEHDMERCKSKAREYGSADLEIMGVAMQALLPGASDLHDRSRHAAGLEMGIGFYLLGKASRLFGAWNKGREPSEDTWHDITIYSLMARFVRDHGGWIR
jgi:hypothetical protein